MRAQVGLHGEEGRRATRPRSSSAPATSTGAPRPSSASRRSRSTATVSARTSSGFRARAVRRCEGAGGARSRRTPPPSWSSRCRARPASSCRPRATSPKCARICRAHNVLLIVDEVQTGLGRTGKVLAIHHEGVKPDGIILGKALGGGLLPVSAFLRARRGDGRVQARRPRQHLRRQRAGRGGGPRRARRAARREALRARRRRWAPTCSQRLRAISSPVVTDVRGKGLLIGRGARSARGLGARSSSRRCSSTACSSKDTHGTVARFAPPLDHRARADRLGAGAHPRCAARVRPGVRAGRLRRVETTEACLPWGSP